MESHCKMAAYLLVLLVAVQGCLALPVQKEADDSLPDILGRLHDVLESLRDYLQEEKADRTNTADKPVVDPVPVSSVEERNEGSSDDDENALDSAAKDVSLRDVLSYLLELERERQGHSKQKTHQQRDHDIPFPFTDKNKSPGK